MLYVRTGPKRLPTGCTVVNVDPLLRELIVRVNRIGALDRRLPDHAHLESVILDELRSLETTPLQIPLPSDPRARKLVDIAGHASPIGLPSDRDLRECGASRRTLERIFREQTALSLGQWLRRYALLRAVGLLSEGEAVSAVAATLGYQSSSAFIAMFRREFGQTPRMFSSVR
jgi:AraC-like DNA-binding protein